MTERYANEAITTLAASMGAGDGTLTVASASAFPTQGDFRIRVDDEILKVTGVSGTTFTASRAVEAVAGVQAAASHAVGATVAMVYTDEGLRSLPLDGTTGTLPAARLPNPLILTAAAPEVDLVSSGNSRQATLSRTAGDRLTLTNEVAAPSPASSAPSSMRSCPTPQDELLLFR